MVSLGFNDLMPSSYFIICFQITIISILTTYILFILSIDKNWRMEWKKHFAHTTKTFMIGSQLFLAVIRSGAKLWFENTHLKNMIFKTALVHN